MSRFNFYSEMTFWQKVDETDNKMIANANVKVLIDILNKIYERLQNLVRLFSFYKHFSLILW